MATIYIANIDFMTNNQNEKFQVEVVLYNQTTNDDESDIYEYLFDNKYKALEFADKVNEIEATNKLDVDDLYSQFTKTVIEIPITEFDIDELTDMLADNTTVTWVYQDNSDNDVTVQFMAVDEYEQRRA